MGMKRLLIIFLGVIFTFTMVGCGSETAEKSKPLEEKAPKTISSDNVQDSLKGYTFKVGTSGTYAPFSYYNSDGKTLIGFDMDFLKALQKLLGFKIDGSIQAMDYSPLTTSVAEGKLDIAMAALCATNTRKKVMNFTDTYYNAGLTVIINKEISPKAITGIESIKSGKYKIAVQKGDASHLYVTEAGVPANSIQVHDSITTVFESLEQGKVDCMVYDAPGTAYYITHKKDSKMAMIGKQFAQDQSPYAIAVSFDASKKYPNLLKTLNVAIQKLTAEGEMAAIEKKWCK